MISDEPVRSPPATERRRTLSYLLLPAIFFLLGVAAMGWILSRWESGARMLGIADSPPAEILVADQPPPAPAVAARPAPAATGEAEEEPERIVIDPEITRRVVELERRIGQIDNQSRAAVGNADRAEGLLVAFAARRALDRGVPLGFLEALLRQRFGDTQPQAVGTVITAARSPVTLQELRDGLAAVAPELAGPGPQAGWWSAFRAELGGLVTVRRAGTPSPAPEEKLRRATRQLEAGQVDVALAEVLRLPNRDRAADWITRARRYVMARRALDAIETAALVDTRTSAVPPAAIGPVQPAAARPNRAQPARPAAQPAGTGQ